MHACRMRLAVLLAAQLLVVDADADASTDSTWPRSAQPFFLSATRGKVTAAEAGYLGRLPVVVINHKQGGTGRAEEKQLAALSQVKAANDSCSTFFYLNSQIDFAGLQLHDQFVAANGSWWLRNDAGGFVLHGSDHIIDVTVAAARSAWLSVAQHALAQPFISGVFVDKAGGFWNDTWTSSHLQMLEALGAAAAAAKKQLIFNNNGIAGMAGQLFERWGNNPDHDGLTVQQDMELLENATGASNAGQLSLARAGGVRPGSDPTWNVSAPEICGAGLAAMLLSVASPNAGFFACMPDFNVVDGWMELDKDPIYQRYLGAPKGKAVVGKDGMITRAFEGADVSLNSSAFAGRSLNRGCVRWASGEITGICP
jgi:hypothetical protein